jgi:hypothetical protein
MTGTRSRALKIGDRVSWGGQPIPKRLRQIRAPFTGLFVGGRVLDGRELPLHAR